MDSFPHLATRKTGHEQLHAVFFTFNCPLSKQDKPVYFHNLVLFVCFLEIWISDHNISLSDNDGGMFDTLKECKILFLF